MRPLLIIALAFSVVILCFGLFDPVDTSPAAQAQAVSSIAPTMTAANRLLERQPGLFVPNLGQWEHSARFVHRNGPMALFLENRGWTLDLMERPAKPKAKPRGAHDVVPRDGEVHAEIRGVALRMTFEGDAHLPEIVGEQKFEGHHNYFIGNEESGWRTGVPLYASVRYERLYPRIDLRLRQSNGVPEYDVLLRPGADLSQVVVHVEGAQGLSVAKDGSLVIATAVGPVTQIVPKTWQENPEGIRREVVCRFRLLGADRFGFEAADWDGDTSLTIDPGLIWSTFLGGRNGLGYDHAAAASVDASGVVTVTGWTGSTNFPTTAGAYDTTHNGGWDIFVSRLDPSKTGSAQLGYSTFVGGSSGDDWASALSVNASGVVTVTGSTWSNDFPTTSGAYNRGISGADEVFVSRLDPSKTGTAQLVYSTFLGGSSWESATELGIDAFGVIAVVGHTWSTDFPTTTGAYDTTYNGGNRDVFVSRLDPSKTGNAQLVYSTFLGGNHIEFPWALSVNAIGVMTLAGHTWSTNFPTTLGAYDTTYNGGYWDVFVSRLDPSKTGNAQLVYSTFLGGDSEDSAGTLSVDGYGLVTLAGSTYSANFPTTSGAYDTTFNGPSYNGDAFVSRLDLRKVGNAQLVYSTFLGGNRSTDRASALSVDASGAVTVGGETWSSDFPTTSGAYSTISNGGGDGFVSRLDPSRLGSRQLVYSTFLGGSGDERLRALSVDASGVVTVAGSTYSTNFPTTSGAYDTTFNGGSNDAFVSRLDMGVALYGDTHAISIKAGGTQRLTVNAGKVHASRLYWIFGSASGTNPGVSLPGVHIPLNPDSYTNLAIATVNTAVFTKFRGTLDANGLAVASFNVPANLPLPSGFTSHHAYVVFDASGKFYMASNAVPVRLK